MKPTIGRIVHFHPAVNPASGADHLPLLTYAAIVTDVVDVGDAREPHLLVMPPGQEPWHCTHARYSEVPAPGCWTWPPRA